jgi:hypothetical protein
MKLPRRQFFHLAAGAGGALSEDLAGLGHHSQASTFALLRRVVQGRAALRDRGANEVPIEHRITLPLVGEDLLAGFFILDAAFIDRTASH